jgi:hypothetical protein
MFAAPKILITSALLLASVPAFGAEETSTVVTAPALPSAIVKCPGVTSIPLTADAEQALPMHIVGSLACGEIVSVLSTDEGYTARIRTPDGKEGYVARMYLIERGNATPAPVRHASAEVSATGVARWSAGAPGCDEFLSHGRHVESITANGVTVQVSLQDTGWKYRANIAISNQSGEKVSVSTGIITLDELQPTLRSLSASDVRKIAGTSTHQVLWTSSNGVPSPSAATGKLQNASEAQRLGYRESASPDYMNAKMTLTSDHPAAFERTDSPDIQAIALKNGSVAAGQSTAGVMWFDRDPAARELSMRVPVGDLVYDFAFAFDPKK